MFLFHDIMIKVFPAGAGDCILVEFIKEDYRILIDGGYAETYRKYLKKHLIELATQGKRINLLIVTHIDSDHIGGIQAFFEENGLAEKPTVIGVDEVWYNAFFHVNTMKVHQKVIPYTIKEVLRCSLAVHNEVKSDGRNDISVFQGNTVAGLLIERGYNWNSLWKGNAVCVKNSWQKQLTDKIQCTLLGPREKELDELAQIWISKLKNNVKKFIVCDDMLYSEAFECYYAHNGKEKEESVRKDVAFDIKEREKEIDLMKWVDEWSGQIDNRETNRSSIAFMLEYEGVKLLFPGDCPIQLFQKNLPKIIDVVKLPHHGSEKNINKEFIDNTEVSYYILSTNGQRHGHPSKQVIANILQNAPNNPIILKNYNIPILKNIGAFIGDEYE